MSDDEAYEIRDPDGRVVGTIKRKPKPPPDRFGWVWPALFLFFSVPAGLLIPALVGFSAGVLGTEAYKTAAGWISIGSVVVFHAAMYLNRENIVGRVLAVIGCLSLLIVAWLLFGTMLTK